MIDVTPKKNILHYSDRPYGGGERVNYLTWHSSGSGLDFCIDSGINWTEVYYHHRGIQMDVCITGSGVWSGNDFIAGTFGIENSAGYRPWETQNNGTFNFQTDYLGSGGQVISRFSTRYTRDSLGLGSYAGPSLTASLQFYKDSGSTGDYHKNLYLRGTQGSLIGSFELGLPYANYYGVVTGSNCNLCIFSDPFCFKHQSDGGSAKTIGYCTWDIYAYDGITRTPLFLGRAWKDQEGRGCMKDEVSGKLFYSLGTKVPIAR